MSIVGRSATREGEVESMISTFFLTQVARLLVLAHLLHLRARRMQDLRRREMLTASHSVDLQLQEWALLDRSGG
jgi:hypothetical protein